MTNTEIKQIFKNVQVSSHLTEWTKIKTMHENIENKIPSFILFE